MPEINTVGEPTPQLQTFEIAREASPDKQWELASMKARIERAFGDEEVAGKVRADFAYTFGQLGLSAADAEELSTFVQSKLLEPAPLDTIERDVLHHFEGVKVKTENGELNLVETLDAMLKSRAEIIYSQVAPYLAGTVGKVLDYGAGDGQIAQRLHDRLGLDIEGVDIRSYAAAGVTVPIHTFNGMKVPAQDKQYEGGLMTNVAHHEQNNERILEELDRVISHRLVVIETVPVGNTPVEIQKDAERTFMSDYLYNRLFHNADVPVPGTFDTSENWEQRFQKYGWKLKHSESLGRDQATINDVHHLLVFER